MVKSYNYSGEYYLTGKRITCQ
uniref:Uncharacterized protein n=1 Tax=Arundo donax TaxID=35708 RepID=A0A0A9H2R8_ARUDO